MSQEISCGAVLYSMRGGTPYYCIVKTNGGHISFPKGHMESGETEPQAAIREIREETGLRIEMFCPGFREQFSYTSRRGNPKDVVFFLADYGAQNVRLQEEELTKFWEVPFEEALALVNTPREKEILQQADSYLASCRNA